MKELSKLDKMYAQGIQHDAHEFFLLLIGSIKTNIPNGIPENPVNKTFEWKMIEIAPAKSKTFLTLFFCYAFLIYFYISPSGVYSMKANCLYSQLQSVFPSERNLPHWKNVWMITPRKRKGPLSALIAELQICWSSKNSVHFQSQLIISYPFYIHID